MSQSTINNRTKKPKKKINLKPYDIAIIVSAVLYAIAEYYNISIPLKWSVGAFLGVIIIAAIGLLIDKRFAKIISIILILALAFAQFYMQFSLNRIVSGGDTSIESTSLVVLIDSDMQSVDDANGRIFGFSNSVSQVSLNNVKEHVSMGQAILLDDDIRVASDLINGEIEVMLLNEATRSTIEEVIEDFSEVTRVLEKIDITIEKEDTSKPVDTAKDGFTILISGIDTSGPVTTVSRSDVNILMTVNPTTHEILTVSIPRDSYVPVSCFDYNYDKLTHSGIRGPECTVSTLENYLGITINYYARVNFTSVLNILDVVGPIDVYSHYTFTTNNGAYTFYEGINTMNSDQALMFSRERYNVPGGDITRGVHQQEVIKATFSKIVSGITPFNIEPLIGQFNQSVDTNFSSSGLSQLLQLQLDQNPSWNFETYAINGEGGMTPTYLYPYQNLYVLYPYSNEVQEATNLINSMK